MELVQKIVNKCRSNINDDYNVKWSYFGVYGIFINKKENTDAEIIFYIHGDSVIFAAENYPNEFGKFHISRYCNKKYEICKMYDIDHVANFIISIFNVYLDKGRGKNICGIPLIDLVIPMTKIHVKSARKIEH